MWWCWWLSEKAITASACQNLISMVKDMRSSWWVIVSNIIYYILGQSSNMVYLNTVFFLFWIVLFDYLLPDERRYAAETIKTGHFWRHHRKGWPEHASCDKIHLCIDGSTLMLSRAHLSVLRSTSTEGHLFRKRSRSHFLSLRPRDYYENLQFRKSWKWWFWVLPERFSLRPSAQPAE